MAAAPGAAPAHGADDFGFIPALKQGGVIAWATVGILAFMSIGSWYIFFVKLIDQNRIINEGRRARTTFWQAASLREGANKLDKNGAYRQIVEDGMLAQEQHDKLTDPIDQHDWMLNSLARSQGAITAKLSSGLAFLATVGSTAPFVGLFGTVVGIYRALIKIGAAGQASISAVAGPVGEALIMTALGPRRRGSRRHAVQLADAPQQVDRRAAGALRQRRARPHDVRRRSRAVVPPVRRRRRRPVRPARRRDQRRRRGQHRRRSQHRRCRAQHGQVVRSMRRGPGPAASFRRRADMRREAE